MNAITATTRNPAAKAKQLRRDGIIPCVVFGKGLPESLPVQIDRVTAQKLARSLRIGSKLDVDAEGKIFHTLIKSIEFTVPTGEVAHISFHVLDDNEKYNSVADIVVLNGDKVPGILEILQRQVSHRAAPGHLLDLVTVDLENKPVGTVITIGDIPEFLDENIELQDDKSSIILRIRDKTRAAANPGA